MRRGSERGDESLGEVVRAGVGGWGWAFGVFEAWDRDAWLRRVVWRNGGMG